MSHESWPRTLLIVTLLPLCWLAMQIVHEAGHTLAGWATGGRMTALVLPPWGISRTDVEPNPAPLIVVWAGPLCGVLLPLGVWGSAVLFRPTVAYLFRFFAGFCLLANGGYIGSGVWSPVGDAAEMLRQHPARWPLATFGLVGVVAGLLLWNGQGRHFGLGADSRPVVASHACGVAIALCLVIVTEVLWTWRTLPQ